MTRTAPARIAIIGCGFTGTTALYQLVEGYPVREIVVFEASGRFGPGYAYGAGNAAEYLINNTTDTMCLVPSNRRAFLEWLKTEPEFADVDPSGHLPRHVYGRFLEKVVAATRVVAAIKNITIRLIPEQVIDVRENTDGSLAVVTEARATVVDRAILATGRCPSIDQLAACHAPAARYIPTHIPADELATVPLTATVHVLGASLSAYDVVNRLFAAESGCRFYRNSAGVLVFDPGPNDRRVVLASRTGRMKKVASRTRMPIRRTVLTEELIAARAEAGALTLHALLDLIREEAKAHGATVDWDRVLQPYAGCRSIGEVTKRAADLLASDLEAATSHPDDKANFLVDLAGDAQLVIWDIVARGWIPPHEEAIYRRHYESSVLTFAAPCPVATAERLLALMHAGRLTVLTGVTDVSVGTDGRYTLRHAHGYERADILVNVTGAVDRRVDSPAQPPLITNMAARGAIRPHDRGLGPLDGIAVDMNTFQLKGQKNVYVASMLLWGPGFFTSSAFMMATVVERLLAAMYAPSS